MKYLKILVISMFVVLFSAPLAFAETSESADKDVKFDNFRGTVENRKEEIKAEIEKARAEAKKKMEEIKANLKNNKNKAKATLAQARLLGREEALKRFDQAIERITNLKGKVDEKISKFETNGQDVQKAKELSDLAETKMTEAKAKIAEASALLAGSSNELSKETKTKLRELTKETQAIIVEAHKSLNDAIKYLKTLRIVKTEEEKTSDQ